MILAGFGAGVVAGLFGVGGGVIFVPTLVAFFEMPQAEAQATSLLAIVPVALVGSYRQHGYGNVAVRDGLTIGALSLPGVVLASWVANELPQSTLKVLFSALCIYVAFRMGMRAIRPEPTES